MTGTLIFIVGPSGVGKDTLLDGARVAFSKDPRVHFLRRDITRPASAGGEDHNPVSAEQFEANRAAGAYALTWDAHDLRYGLPKSELAPLERGTSVIANGSRSVLDLARNQFDRLAIISVMAEEKLLRSRLMQRGRETQKDIEQRIARATAFQVAGEDVTTFSNNDSVEVGIARFSQLIENLHKNPMHADF